MILGLLVLCYMLLRWIFGKQQQNKETPLPNIFHVRATFLIMRRTTK